MKEQELIKFLKEKQVPGNWLEIANLYEVPGTNKEKSDRVRRLWHSEIVNFVQTDLPFTPLAVTTTDSYDPDYAEFLEFKKQKQRKLPRPYLKGNPDNVLFIGDIHLPFVMEGYLDFCRKQQERFNCGKIIFAGDVVDHHAQSFHNSNPDGLSAKDELLLAVEALKDWHSVFPNASVLLGNHDRIIARKLFSTGLSQRWMKPLEDVLETPTWSFVEQVIHNDVLYVHGEGGTAIKKAQQEMMSVCQGHLHTEGYIQFINGGKNFGMQVGSGIDFKSYAFAYAQRGKKPVLSCGVVLNQSRILIPFLDDSSTSR